MKCFNHRAVEAIAVCKSCGRALCPDGIAEVDLACSCKGPCEDVVGTMNDLVERGRTAYQKASVRQFRNGIFIVMGGIFASLSVYRLFVGDSSEWIYVLLLMGVLFTGMGVVALIAARRLRQK